MRRFKFTLQSVLMLREKTLEDERIKLAKIIENFNREKIKLDELISSLKALKEGADTFLNGQINPELISNYQAYVLKVSNDVLNQEQVLKEIEQKIEKQKLETKKAYTEVKILEKLKEKQKEKYDKEFLFEEIKFIDDILTSRKRA